MRFEDVKIGMSLQYNGWGNNTPYLVVSIDPLDGRVLLDGPNGYTHWAKDSQIWYNVSVYVKPAKPAAEYQVIWHMSPVENRPVATFMPLNYTIKNQHELYRLPIKFNHELIQK
jgi:hypothetical protein